MATQTQADLTRHSEQIAGLVARVDHLRGDLDRIEGLIARSEGQSARSQQILQDVDKRLAIVSRDAERLEKRLDETLSRRYELSKLVLAAVLGGILTLVTGVLGRWLERLAAPPVRIADQLSPFDTLGEILPLGSLNISKIGYR